MRFGRGETGDGLGGWVILPEPVLHLDEDAPEPEIAEWRAEGSIGGI